jgi:hypothetical protein
MAQALAFQAKADVSQDSFFFGTLPEVRIVVQHNV